MKLGFMLILLGLSMLCFSLLYPMTIGPAEKEIYTIPKDGGVYKTLTQVLVVTPTYSDREATKVVWLLDPKPVTVQIEPAPGLELSVREQTSTSKTWTASIENPSVGEHNFTFTITWTSIEAPSVFPKPTSWQQQISGRFTIAAEGETPNYETPKEEPAPIGPSDTEQRATQTQLNLTTMAGLILTGAGAVLTLTEKKRR